LRWPPGRVLVFFFLDFFFFSLPPSALKLLFPVWERGKVLCGCTSSLFPRQIRYSHFTWPFPSLYRVLSFAGPCCFFATMEVFFVLSPDSSRDRSWTSVSFAPFHVRKRGGTHLFFPKPLGAIFPENQICFSEPVSDFPFWFSGKRKGFRPPQWIIIGGASINPTPYFIFYYTTVCALGFTFPVGSPNSSV